MEDDFSLRHNGESIEFHDSFGILVVEGAKAGGVELAVEDKGVVGCPEK